MGYFGIIIRNGDQSPIPAFLHAIGDYLDNLPHKFPQKTLLLLHW